MVDLTVTFLGTSSAAPTRGRGLPSIVIQREGEVVILDCGEGVQRELLSAGVGLNKPTTILVTHLHGDHVTGLLGLLQTMSLSQRRRPLVVVGPALLRRWLEATAKLLKIGLTFPVQFVQVHPGALLTTRSFKIKASKAVHSVEAYCYLVEEKPRPGKFHPELARDLGVEEGRLWSKLQHGKAVVVGGKRIAPRMVLGEPRPGRRVGYSGDTRPNRRLSSFFHGCDLLVFDSTFSHADYEKAVERKHSTSVEAARLALSSESRLLALTHFSARYRSIGPLLREARAVFPNTIAAKDGLRLGVEPRPASQSAIG